MSDDEPKDESTDDSEQQADEQATDSDQPPGQAEEQPTESDQTTEQAEEQPADEQPSEQATEQPAESDQSAEQTEDQAAESEQPAEQAEGQPADGDQSAGSASADVQPAKGGSPPTGPRKRKPLFRFAVQVDYSALNLAPDSVKTAVGLTIDKTASAPSILDLTDYFFGFAIVGRADAGPVHTIDDGWERIPSLGVIDFSPKETVERASFLVGVAVIPNSKVDPTAPTSEPLTRAVNMRTDGFAPFKPPPDLKSKSPDGIFILQINLVALYILIPVAGSGTFEAELAQAKIRPEDIRYKASSPLTDASGKAIGTKYDVVYWSTALHLSGKKYTP